MDNKVKAHLALLAVNIFYGAGFTVAKFLMPRLIQPLGFILIRVSVVCVLFWMSYALGKKYRKRIRKKDWPILILGGLFGVAANQMLFFLGLNNTMPIHASLIMMSTPIIITILSLFLLKERLKWDKAVGLLLGIAGASLLMSAGKELTTLGKNTAWGDFLVFLNATSYAIYLVIIKPVMVRYRPVIVIRWVFLFGFLFVLPFGWQQFAIIQWSAFAAADWLALAFVVMFVTFFAYLWNIFAVKHLSPSTAGAYIYFQPFFAGLISVIVMGEEVTWMKIFAAILIFTGVYFVNFGLNKQPNKQ
ncbi:MAG: DMT family transporter [Chitinophagaceae bacterium]|nr:DMT family transporter [Chitinophagaceae bacterium]MCB9044918.1 DMT family transporter [Chitinophagales bacterium]